MSRNYRIGLVIPLRGPGGMYGPSCEAVAKLAAATLNDNGGILAREVEIEVIDASLPGPELQNEITQLMARDQIHAVTGWHISTVREQLAPVLTHRIPYVYTSLYEGGESRPGVICSGETPALQIAPALRWLQENIGVQRWAVVGANYVWPRRTVPAIREYCHQLDLQIVEEVYVNYGTTDYSRVLPRIEHSGAEGIIMLLVGRDAVAFNRAFSEQGLHHRILRFSPLMEENMLLASGADATENLYVAASYFQNLVSASAQDFMSDYVHRFGPSAPPLNNAAESCYEGVATLGALATAAASTDVDEMALHRGSVSYDGPRGFVHASGGLMHQDVHIAVADGYEFDVVATL
ncbi:substrate-binding domain-containing protein [Mycobacterium sp. NPDC004974]